MNDAANVPPKKEKPSLFTSSDDLPPAPYHRLLIQALPKDGKTWTSIATSEGPTVVINSDDRHSLEGVARDGYKFDTVFCSGVDVQRIFTIIEALKVACNEGKYKTVIWDTASKYAWRAVEVYADATKKPDPSKPDGKSEPDGRRYWLPFTNHMLTISDMLVNLNAHVIVNVHYQDSYGKEIDGQAPKTGDGIVAHLPGSALRTNFARDYQNVVMLQINHKGEREFLWKRQGVFGLGGRTLPKDVTSCEANVQTLWKLIQGEKKT